MKHFVCLEFKPASAADVLVLPTLGCASPASPPPSRADSSSFRRRRTASAVCSTLAAFPAPVGTGSGSSPANAQRLCHVPSNDGLGVFGTLILPLL